MRDDDLIIGGGNAGMNPLSINITPDDVTGIVCQRCGCPLFNSAYPLGKISGIKLGLPNDQIVAISEPTHLCVRCGYPAGQPFNREDVKKEEVVEEDEEAEEDILDNITRVEFGKKQEDEQ